MLEIRKKYLAKKARLILNVNDNFHDKNEMPIRKVLNRQNNVPYFSHHELEY